MSISNIENRKKHASRKNEGAPKKKKKRKEKDRNDRKKGSTCLVADVDVFRFLVSVGEKKFRFVLSLGCLGASGLGRFSFGFVQGFPCAKLRGLSGCFLECAVKICKRKTAEKNTGP